MERQIIYNEEANLFLDEGWHIIENIYREILPNMIYLFKLKRDDMFVYGRRGEFIELVYERKYEDVYGDYENIIDRREIRR